MTSGYLAFLTRYLQAVPHATPQESHVAWEKEERRLIFMERQSTEPSARASSSVATSYDTPVRPYQERQSATSAAHTASSPSYDNDSEQSLLMESRDKRRIREGLRSIVTDDGLSDTEKLAAVEAMTASVETMTEPPQLRPASSSALSSPSQQLSPAERPPRVQSAYVTRSPASPVSTLNDEIIAQRAAAIADVERDARARDEEHARQVALLEAQLVAAQQRQLEKQQVLPGAVDTDSSTEATEQPRKMVPLTPLTPAAAAAHAAAATPLPALLPPSPKAVTPVPVRHETPPSAVAARDAATASSSTRDTARSPTHRVDGETIRQQQMEIERLRAIAECRVHSCIEINLDSNADNSGGGSSGDAKPRMAMLELRHGKHYSIDVDEFAQLHSLSERKRQALMSYVAGVVEAAEAAAAKDAAAAADAKHAQVAAAAKAAGSDSSHQKALLAEQKKTLAHLQQHPIVVVEEQRRELASLQQQIHNNNNNNNNNNNTSSGNQNGVPAAVVTTSVTTDQNISEAGVQTTTTTTTTTTATGATSTTMSIDRQTDANDNANDNTSAVDSGGASTDTNIESSTNADDAAGGGGDGGSGGGGMALTRTMSLKTGSSVDATATTTVPSPSSLTRQRRRCRQRAADIARLRQQLALTVHSRVEITLPGPPPNVNAADADANATTHTAILELRHGQHYTQDVTEFADAHRLDERKRAQLLSYVTTIHTKMEEDAARRRQRYIEEAHEDGGDGDGIGVDKTAPMSAAELQEYEDTLQRQLARLRAQLDAREHSRVMVQVPVTGADGVRVGTLTREEVLTLRHAQDHRLDVDAFAHDHKLSDGMRRQLYAYVESLFRD